MAIIINPRRWTVQPPPGTQINSGHPLAVGLTFYVVMNQQGGLPVALRPFIRGTALGTKPTNAYRAAPGGSAAIFSSVFWGIWFERGPWVEPAGSFTVVSRMRRTGAIPSGGANPINKNFNNAGSAPFLSYAFAMNNANAGQDNIQSFIGTTGTGFFGGTNLNLGTGFTLNPHTVGMQVNYLAATPQLRTFANGLLLDTSTGFTGGISYDTSANGRFGISTNSSATAGGQYTGDIYFAGVWNRLLTGNEMKWLHAEPYAMLVPPRRVRYFIPAPATIPFSGGQPNICVATF